ncbi:hypothetical protein Bca4012_014994 [Brassica carinata]|uniref:RRM domain-containing protein n=1 Tax=Brassica carinata TaxID=52824 RepID=A0A8X7TGU2_BRACI|nr:hypothetical protein Bca52824_091433 [Brassica carinata]
MSDDDDLFRRSRPFNQLDVFYTDWSRHLTERRIPPLLILPSDAKNDAVLADIGSYYDTLDFYANKHTILYLIFPSWRSNSLETPILFLGDINPRLFTSLIQSFVDGLDQDPVGTYGDLAASWENLSSELGNTINETVSRLLGEMSEAQERFVKRFSDNWVSSFLRSQNETVIMETTVSLTRDQDHDGGAILEELVRIFREANQLRWKTITDIVGVLNMDQRAVFLERVCKLLAGFKHQDHAFENSQFGNNLNNQNLPGDDHELLLPPAPPGEAINAHQNHPQAMMQHDAPLLPPPNYHFFRPLAPTRFAIPHPLMMPLLQPRFYQVFPPFPPPRMVIGPPPMMQPYAHQPPPQPMMQHQQQDHVIYVGNLAPEATDDLLLQEFSCYPSVRESKICRNEGGYTYGFVSFADVRDKMHAMTTMNGKIFLGWAMHIGLAAKNTI